MVDSKKNSSAKAVVSRWCAFQEALGGTKRKYPMEQFLSFIEAARHYIDLTRHDQLRHRDVAKAINGLTELRGQRDGALAVSLPGPWLRSARTL
jgi:hypothetical protein